MIEIVEEKDKKGRRTVEYLIHFQGEKPTIFLAETNTMVIFVFYLKGWNSSWDRAVHEDFVLKDTDKNRQLQRHLAEKSQLQMYKFELLCFNFALINQTNLSPIDAMNSGAYLYRKERKKRKGSNTNVVEAKMPFRPSSDDGSSCCSITPGNVAQEEIPEIISSMIILLFNYSLKI